jgi:HEAT repeat protein
VTVATRSLVARSCWHRAVRGVVLASILFTGATLPAQCIGTPEVYGWDVWWSANREDFLRWRAEPAGESDAGRVRRLTPAETRDQIVPVLVAALGDGDASVRDAAALALGRCGGPSEVATLARALDDRNRLVVAAAILGLGLLSQPGADQLLATKLADPAVSARDRGLAAIALGLSGGETARKPLFDGLGSRRPTSVEACRMLGGALWAGADRPEPRTDRTPLAASLLQRALDNPVMTSGTVRNIGVAALAKVRDPGSLQFVMTALASPDAEVRAAAAVAAGRVVRADDARSVRAVIAALRVEATPWPRDMMRIALGRIGGPDAVQQLVKDLDQPESAERGFVMLALGIAGALEIAPRFRDELFSNTRERLKAALAIALGLMNDAAADRLVERLILDGNSNAEVAQHALSFFALRRARDSAPFLVRILETTHVPCVQESAAIALGAMGAVDAQPALVKLLLGGPDGVKPSAALALGRMGHRGALDALLAAAIGDGVAGTTRTAAIAGLGILAQRDDASMLARASIDSVYDPANDAIDEVCWRAGKARIIYEPHGSKRRK